ncbi:endo-1,4-beta-xylanase [Maricaulaceae bacterium NA33B04]|nr:endo-1,4-beta-xylanase [Maricaulaceae bacterium NA33B04]
MTQPVSRRQVLGWGGAAVAILAAPAHTLKTSSSLNALAEAKGLRFGSAVGAGARGSLRGSFHDPRYRQLLTQECGLLVHENELKWYVIRPSADVYDFAPADLIMEFADREGLAVRGHTLVWNREEFESDWLNSHDFGTRPASEAERLIVEHIRTVVDRYRGRIGSWDVVNETIDPETGQMRDTVLTRLLGERLLDIAHNAVREADPEAQLVYNDYMSWDEGHEAHRDGVLTLIQGMRDRGVPIDALGLQSHIWAGRSIETTGFDTTRDETWRDFLSAVTSMDVDLLVTEFDVNDTNLPFDIEGRDRAIAELAEHYLNLVLSFEQARDVLVWGMADPYSWLQNLWLRPDGEAKRPTPYDADFQAKPLRDAIARAFINAVPR